MRRTSTSRVLVLNRRWSEMTHDYLRRTRGAFNFKGLSWLRKLNIIELNIYTTIGRSRGEDADVECKYISFYLQRLNN